MVLNFGVEEREIPVAGGMGILLTTGEAPALAPGTVTVAGRSAAVVATAARG